MSDDPINLAMIGRLIRCRWRLLLALAAAGGLLGMAAAVPLAPGYASSSKVLLLGDRAKDSLAGEMQVATSLVALDRTAAALNWGLSGRDLQDRVSATMLNGNVLQVNGTAPTPELAQQLTDAATREYVTYSSQIVGEAAAAASDASQRSRQSRQQRLDEAKKRAADLAASPAVAVAGPDGDQARSDLQQAQAQAAQMAGELEAADKRQEDSELTDSMNQAKLRVIEPAVLPTGPASPTMFQLIGAGTLLLPALGILSSLVGLRSDRRVRSRSELAAILGAPVLADVTVPRMPPTGRLAGFRDDRRWVPAESPVVEDELGRAARYRRVLSRIRTGNRPQRLLALLDQDDRYARLALIDLAVAAVTAGRAVSLSTEDESLAEAVRQAADANDADGLTVEEPGRPPAVADLLLAVAVFSHGRPAMPDASVPEPTVLITTAGTWTPFELNEVAGACLEAGRPLAGALLVVPAEADGRQPGADVLASSMTTAAS